MKAEGIFEPTISQTRIVSQRCVEGKGAWGSGFTIRVQPSKHQNIRTYCKREITNY